MIGLKALERALLDRMSGSLEVVTEFNPETFSIDNTTYFDGIEVSSMSFDMTPILDEIERRLK